MTVKLRKASPLAAYLVAPGLTAEEAAAEGLVQVETDHNGYPVFGRYGVQEADEKPSKASTKADDPEPAK